jgi:hypothetical protein
MKILQIRDICAESTLQLKTEQKPYISHGLHNEKTGVVYPVDRVLAINLNAS